MQAAGSSLQAPAANLGGKGREAQSAEARTRARIMPLWPLPRDSPELSPLPLRTHSAAAAPLREASCSPISRTLSAHGSSPSHLPCDLGQDAASSSVVGSPVHHVSSPLANVPDGSVDDGGLLRLFSRLFPAFLSQPSHQPCKRHTVPRYLLLPG